MAGNKVNTKRKDDRGKGNKNGSQPMEENDDFDYAMLRKPIPTSVTGFVQAKKIFDLATEELKDLITNECDLLYECKVCRNIFRSLVNFISHKRVYCKEKFNSTFHGHFLKNTSAVNEYLKIKQMEDGYQESLKVKDHTENLETDDSCDRIPLTKDLTAILENVTKSRGVREGVLDEVQQVTLQKIPSSSVAVFQSMNFDEDSQDFMGSQVQELDDILSQDKAVLQSDGKFTVESSNNPPAAAANEEIEGVIQISDDEEDESGDVLKCKTCNLQFSTMKTLRFHMKYKHLESRLVYPCPDCVDIFSTSWSVYRHLFKVHRKTAAQIRRLRESIQAKAFRKNNPPAFYEKRKNNLKSATDKKISEEERLDQENQAWIDNMEGDGAAPRCGGCGRSFERRAALAAHTVTCQPRSRALTHNARRGDQRKIEIQIRKDYNKGPSNVTLTKNTDTNGNKVSQDENSQPSIKSQKDTEKEELEEATMYIDDEEVSNDKEALYSLEKSNDSAPEVPPPVNKTQSAYISQAENHKSNLAALKLKMALNKSDVDIEELQCKMCNVTKDTMPDLAEHMAFHYKWMRYACKLCHFKNYYMDKVAEHVKTVHKLKGDNDFYCSTVKSLSGAEAEELCDQTEDVNEENDTSPSSRRPSRCSSDSSRLSDDSSSSARVEGFTKKRKLIQIKPNAKKRKENDKDETEDQSNADPLAVDNEAASNVKSFEENSSDFDDLEEKLSKRAVVERAPRSRPIRKRTRPKNEDFEYDLSNLLKRDAQGYRESQGVTTSYKPPQIKKKLQDPLPTINEINKDYKGALLTMSKKSVQISAALFRPYDMSIFNANKNDLLVERVSYPFIKPLLPKSQSKADKSSPKKDAAEEKEIKVVKTYTSTNSGTIMSSSNSIVGRKKQDITKEMPEKDATKSNEKDVNVTNEKETFKVVKVSQSKSLGSENSKGPETSKVFETTKTVETPKVIETSNVNETPKVNETSKTNESTKSEYIPAVLPIKYRRHSIELMNNPIINKNITELSKSGMKTKILVIKPIHRKKDGTASLGSALKFQTIKLKDPTKSTTETTTDRVKFVKLPKDIKITTRISKDQSEDSTTVEETATEDLPSTNEYEDENQDISPETSTKEDAVNDNNEAASQCDNDNQVITIHSSPNTDHNIDTNKTDDKNTNL